VSRRVSGGWKRIETNEPDWDGIGAARRRLLGRNPAVSLGPASCRCVLLAIGPDAADCGIEHVARLVESGGSGTLERAVVTDSAPPAAKVIVDGDEFEGGAAIGAGE